MLTLLNSWNRWGIAKLKSGYPRDILQKIKLFIDTREILTLTGLRHAGKTTLLFQLMDCLEKQGISPTAMLHMNFEDPALAPQLQLSLLDEIYHTYRTEIYPKGKAYIFFDEIQNVPEWERWVRARNESEDIKIFITGSSANLMSRELATRLTGRHVNFHISPLSFAEFLRFKDIEVPEKIRAVDAPAEIQHALNEYIQWGGLPEVVLSQENERKKIILKQYVDDILFKDVALRHQIREVSVLRNLAVHLLTQTGSLISMNRLAKLFQISLEMASTYCAYLQEAYFIDLLPFYSLKVAERNRNPQKVYANDLGLRAVASFTATPDKGRLLETLVYQQLCRMFPGDIFYWKGKQEVDFVIRSGNDIYALIQVVSEQENSKTFLREISALEEAKQQFHQAQHLVITAKMPKLSDSHQLQDSRVKPLWWFMLMESIF